MSTFRGRLKEYQYFSLDRFDGDNINSKMFFLSHCHKDHMVGLDSAEFFKLLQKNNYKIYVQEVTAHLLLSEPIYIRLKPYVIPLEVNVPYPFSVSVDGTIENFVVTLLSAGHCPGSVMFLIEGKEGVVLYTGDIRLTKDDLEQMPALKTRGKLKQLKSIYFDSTFCIRLTYVIPTRQESRDALIALVKSWLKQNPLHKVLLSCAAKYGQEYLFCELSTYFGMKIHIPETKNEIYSKIPDIARHVTTRASETRIHACSYWETENDNKEMNRRSATCPDCCFWDKNVIIIKPSMLYFAQTKSVNSVIHKDERGIYRIKYSSHSSLKEIREIIAYLKPERAYPNVVPYRSNYTEIHEAIKDLLPKTPTKNIDDALSLSPIKSFSSKNLLTFRKRFELLERSFDESELNSPKKLKLSSTPTKNVTLEARTESNWDLWSHIKISQSSTSLSPQNVSQDCSSTRSPIRFKLHEICCEEDVSEDENDCSEELSKVNDGQVASEDLHNPQEGSCSQKSDIDLFRSNVEEHSLCAADESSKDLFEDSNETLRDSFGYQNRSQSRIFSQDSDCKKEFNFASEETSFSANKRHKANDFSDIFASTSTFRPVDEFCDNEPSKTSNGPENVSLRTITNEDLIEKVNDSSEEVVENNNIVETFFSQSSTLTDSSSIEILEEHLPNVSLKRQSSSIEIIETVKSNDITILFETTRTKNEIVNIIDECYDADSWLSKKSLKKAKNDLK